MAKMKKKSGLVGSLGAEGKKAFDATKGNEVKMGRGGEPPAGIENGVARLTSAKFDTYKNGANQGKYYFMARATIVSPKSVKVNEFNRVDTKGVPTHIEGREITLGPEPVCHTPNNSRKTVEEHMAWIVNELKKLGLSTEEINWENIEDAVAALTKAGPYTAFRTWKSEPNEEYPDPRTFHDWGGVVDFDPSDEDDGVYEAVDATEEEDEETDNQEGEGEAEDDEIPFDELEELGTQADEGDDAAQVRLLKYGESIGMTQDEMDNVDDWATLATLISDSQNEAGEEEEEESSEDEETEEYEGEVPWEVLGEQADDGDNDAENSLNEKCAEVEIDPNEYATWKEVGQALDELEATEFVPGVEEIYKYKPPRSKSSVEVEVVEVDEEAQTVKVKDTKSGKTYAKVGWDKLNN